MSHLPIGAILNSEKYSYVVEEVLGKGGFGVTYKVSSIRKVGNVEARCTFAMKEHYISDWCERKSDGKEVTCSNPVKERVENSKLDFLAEARRLQQVLHSSIISVDEVFEANNTAYYVMEYVDSGNLHDYIAQNGCLSEDVLVELLLPVLNAVNRLHDHRMTHLDIKPANIMMKQLPSGEIRPILIDFGLSKHYDEHGNATSTVRSQGYSDGYAPIEQYAGIDTFSPQSDIYAIAATMIYCLTGNRPPRAIDVDDEVVNSLLPSSISANMRNAIVKAMRGSRSKRTKSMMEFIEDVCGDKVTSESSVVVNEQELSAPSTTPIETSSATQVFGNDSATQVSGTASVTHVSENNQSTHENEESSTSSSNDGSESKKKMGLGLIAIVLMVIVIWYIFPSGASTVSDGGYEYDDSTCCDTAMVEDVYSESECWEDTAVCDSAVIEYSTASEDYDYSEEYNTSNVNNVQNNYNSTSGTIAVDTTVEYYNDYDEDTVGVIGVY